MNQINKANALRSFHIKGNPLILFNIWDAGSARAMQRAGAKVIATSSWAVAAAHGVDDLEEAITRSKAYAESGADGFFAPGLKDAKHIKKLCEHSPIPVNIMVLSDTSSLKELSELGVARISYGPYPHCQMLDTLTKVVTDLNIF